MVWPPPLVSGYVEKPYTFQNLPNNDFEEAGKSQDNSGKKLYNNRSESSESETLDVTVLTNREHHPNCSRSFTNEFDNKPLNQPILQELYHRDGSKYVIVVEQTGNIIGSDDYDCPKGRWPGRLIMSPPHYGDLGKQARDVFSKGYHFGLIKLDIKTKTNTGVEFSTGGVSNRDTGKVFGSLESKYKFKDYGVTFTERWNTDNVLATEIALSDFCDGGKISLDTSFAPHTGDKSVKIKAEYKNDVCALCLDTDFKQGGPVLRGSAVVGYSGWLIGCLSAFDAAKSKLIDNRVTMGFVAKDFILNTSMNDGRVFSGSIFHKVNHTLETGVQLSWSADSNDTDFGIGCKYALDQDASLRFKVNNRALVGLGYQQKLKDGVTMFLSAQIDSKNFNEGGHKIGFALELEA